MDDEVQGTGNQYDYGFRIYNPRLAKFLSVDPLAPEYPWYTPYQFAGNTPIQAIDLDGLEEIHYTLIIDRNKGTTELKYSHSVDIVDKVLVTDRKPTQWMDPGKHHFEERVNQRKVFVLDIFDPGYGTGREGRTETYREKSTGFNQRMHTEYNSHAGSGAGYAEAYSFDVYDYGAGRSGQRELSNAQKNRIDANSFELLLAAIPITKIVKLPRFIVRSSKFDYFFGRVTSSLKNQQRSLQNLKDLTTLGIKSEGQLLKYFDDAARSGEEVGRKTTNFGTTVIKSVQIGDKGALEVGFFYKGSNMTITPEVASIIPKIAKK